VLLIDRELTPGDNYQAEDRLHIAWGKANAVTSIWLSAFEVDYKIDDMNAGKQQRIDAVIAREAERPGDDRATGAQARCSRRDKRRAACRMAARSA